MTANAGGLVDLHRHLDGSLRASTLDELARHAGVSVPSDIRFSTGMGLDAALSKFGFILELLQTPQSVRRVASEICEDAEREGITTLEIRFAPQLHGSSIDAAVDAALEGIDGRAGLILCGLYGDDPSIVETLVRSGARRKGVVGIDLAGGPASDHRWRLRDYRGAFHAAADSGLGRTVHAGEGRPPAEIRTAIEVLGAQRIGHGTTLLGDPRVVELVVERNVTIEACPTSNVHTGAIPSIAAHPLREWLARGVSVCICSDNTFFSDVTAASELDLVARDLDLSTEEVEILVANGRTAAFQR